MNELPTALIGIFIGSLETLIGISLLFRKTRKTAVLSAVAMHIFILGLLIAKNYNSIVWIWNAALMAIVIIAFWQSEVFIRDIFNLKLKTAKIIVLSSVLLPLSSFFGFWEMYLSGALFSGSTETAVIRIDDDVFDKLPPTAQKVVFRTKTNEMKVLPLFEWAINELNVPVYPEKRIFRRIFREICSPADNKQQPELIIKERPSMITGNYKVVRSNCLQND